VSDGIFAREQLEVGDVTRPHFLAEFEARRSVNARHLSLVVGGDGDGSPFKWIPFLWNSPVGVERWQHFRHRVYVANLLPIKFPVFVIEE